MNASVVLSIGRFEFTHYLKDKVALFTVLVLPMVLVIVIGMSFGGQPESFAVGVHDADGTPTSAAFVEGLDEASLTTTGYSDPAALARDIRLGFVSGGVTIDAGFEAALQAPSGQAGITLAVEFTSTNASAVASAITAAAAQFALEPTAVRVTTAAVGTEDTQAVSAIASEVVAAMPPVTTRAVTVGEAVDDNGFARAVTTQFILFTFLNGMLAGMTLVEARRLGVARRMLSTPTGIGPHILGVGLGRWCLGMAQAALLFGTGALLFDAGFGALGVTAVLVMLWAALSAAVGMLLGAVAKTPDQVVAFAVPLGIGMGMLGGSMWPLSVVPPFMRTLGHLTPHAWANDAFNSIVEEGGGLSEVAAEIAVLGGITAVLAVLAVVLLRRSLSR